MGLEAMASSVLLYYITDRRAFPGDESVRHKCLLEKIVEAARADIDYIQLREKDLPARDLEALAHQAVRILSQLRMENLELRTKLLINSRADLAVATGADGVHLRSEDISPQRVRMVWKEAGCGVTPEPVIAVSCHTREEIEQAQTNGADFAVFAPVFEKRGATPAGLARLRDACRVKIPVLALGGVTLENAQSALKAGAAGIAGIRLFQENRISKVTSKLRQKS